MKKILLAFDNSHFSDGAFEFARRINELSGALLTGVFLPQVDYANLWSYSGGGLAGPLYVPLVEQGDAELLSKNIDRFSSLCRKNDIDYRVHRDFFEFALPELKKESRFADLLLVGSESFYDNIGTGNPNDYLKDAMRGIECPAIIVPEKFDFPETNVLAYDGSASSVYAIKQFAYLFPELAENSTVLIYAKQDPNEKFPEEQNIEELAARHFPDLTLFRFEANPRKYFNSWLLERKSAMLVSGSFGRSGISSWLHQSFVGDIIRDHRIPVFVTHH